MLVYACFECRYSGGDEFRELHRLFRNELDALRWCEEDPNTMWKARFYQPIELE